MGQRKKKKMWVMQLLAPKQATRFSLHQAVLKKKKEIKEKSDIK